MRSMTYSGWHSISTDASVLVECVAPDASTRPSRYCDLICTSTSARSNFLEPKPKEVESVNASLTLQRSSRVAKSIDHCQPDAPSVCLPLHWPTGTFVQVVQSVCHFDQPFSSPIDVPLGTKR